MKRKFVRVFVILFFMISGCQNEPVSQYVLPVESQYFLGKDSYAIYDNFFNKSGTEDKDSLSQNEKTEQQS